jgi:predicted DNA-binding transcriptional regulator AlpA
MSFYVPPARHHLDRWASALAEHGRGDPDDLLTTPALAEWLQVSSEWLEIGRSRGYGPKFIRLSPSRVRYRRSDVLEWLAERTRVVTAKRAAR